MKKFMIMFQSPASASETMAQSTPEEMKASMADWMKWKEKVEATGAGFEFGMPMQARKHIDKDGNVTDGTSQASGYSMIETDSVDAAVELVKDHPHLKRPGASIELLEFVPMPGISHK
jgi:hypothetical protein